MGIVLSPDKKKSLYLIGMTTLYQKLIFQKKDR